MQVATSHRYCQGEVAMQATSGVMAMLIGLAFIEG
jgi:hypothetical protein